MFLCDFHIHSQFSDGALSITELVDFYGQRGFGAIAVTDHLCEASSLLGHTARLLNRTLTRHNFASYLETLAEEAERAWRVYKMVVIPGVEITKNSLSHHRSAHVLSLGTRHFYQADHDVDRLLKEIRHQGGVSVAAHPVSTGKFEPQTYHLWSRREELAPLFDAWEVASGPRLFPEVVKTKLPKLANSDLHHPRQMSSWKTKLSCERHPEAILESIRRQDVEFAFFHNPAPPLTAPAGVWNFQASST